MTNYKYTMLISIRIEIIISMFVPVIIYIIVISNK